MCLVTGAESPLGNCVECGGSFGPGTSMAVNGKYYHKNCFTCYVSIIQSKKRIHLIEKEMQTTNPRQLQWPQRKALLLHLLQVHIKVISELWLTCLLGQPLPSNAQDATLASSLAPTWRPWMEPGIRNALFAGYVPLSINLSLAMWCNSSLEAIWHAASDTKKYFPNTLQFSDQQAISKPLRWKFRHILIPHIGQLHLSW